MLVVRVELHSANTGRVSELARMEVCNVGGKASDARGDYAVRALRGRTRAALDKREAQRAAFVSAYPRQRLHVWCLVARALKAMGYE